MKIQSQGTPARTVLGAPPFATLCCHQVPHGIGETSSNTNQSHRSGDCAPKCEQFTFPQARWLWGQKRSASVAGLGVPSGGQVPEFIKWSNGAQENRENQNHHTSPECLSDQAGWKPSVRHNLCESSLREQVSRSFLGRRLSLMQSGPSRGRSEVFWGLGEHPKIHLVRAAATDQPDGVRTLV